jgi:hypothetical protein
METMQLHNSSEIHGIYVTPAHKVIGIPLFRQNGQEFRESPKCVELWQKNSEKKMHLKKRWRKTSISYIEYEGIPNIWIEAKSFQHK